MHIESVLDALIAEVSAGRPAALCAIVATRGSTPLPAGTMLCVDQAAGITGTLGGGCVEAEVRRRAHQLLGAGRSELITFDLDHDFGYDDGMICGGQMDVAVSVISASVDADRLDAQPEAPSPYPPTLPDPPSSVGSYDPRSARMTPPRSARLTPPRSAHPIPRSGGEGIGEPNHAALSRKGGRGQGEGDLRCTLSEVRERLANGRAATLPLRVRTAQGVAEYRVHLETSPELLIAGAGHISRILAPLAVRLGFQVCVIDDRMEYANADRFPPPIRPIVGDIAGTLRTWPMGGHTYVVIVTRGHKHDEKALAAGLAQDSNRAPARYLGMIGSRRKIKVIFDDLRHQGVTPEQLNRVHAPVGLDIGAITTEEIALSIAAELVSVRRADRRQAVEGPFPVTDVPP